MKILLYSANFAPEPTGIGKYSGEMAAWLAAQGHEVRVVAAPPYYPVWQVERDYRWPPYRREQWCGVKVWRAPLWVPKSPGGLTRILHLLSFALTSLPLMLRHIFWRPDLVISIAPAFCCAPIALLTARLSGAHSWLHMQDFEVDIAFRMELLRGKLLQHLILAMERSVLRKFDSVSSISSRMVERLLEKGVSRDRVRYFPNWVDTTHIKTVSDGGAYRAQLGIAADAIVVLYSGTLGGKQGLMVIPTAASLLASRKDIVFVVCGDGVMKPEVESASAELPNVLFIPLQPFERLGDLLCTADIHLLPQGRRAADLVLPSKLSGMLASGRPVISTCVRGSELDSIVSKCGLVVAPQDGAALAEGICRLADDAELRLSLGRRARAYAEANFERDKVLGRVFGPMVTAEARVAAGERVAAEARVAHVDVRVAHADARVAAGARFSHVDTRFVHVEARAANDDTRVADDETSVADGVVAWITPSAATARAESTVYDSTA
jgi:putative colanic acid biosynthesis glycosyltransferase WcaI